MTSKDKNSSIAAIIPARGGSKGLPRKNIRVCAGKPLIAWTIDSAKKARMVDRVLVSTDDKEISAISKECGAEVIVRPSELARDNSTSEEALAHALHYLDAEAERLEAIVFLQATSPVRADDDIDRAVDLFRAAGADSLLSVTLSHSYLWEEKDGIGWPLSCEPHGRLLRQEMRPQYAANGSIFIFEPSVLARYGSRFGQKTVLYKMPEETSIDIDTELDFLLAETILRIRERE